MQAKYIKFPQTSEERREIMIRFSNQFQMPGVLGCIDCTHVAIVSPEENEERYYCRKQYHSLNVQLISNADMQIVSVDASFGGATHDSFI
ncbi:putative nuclease HARBI1 [Ostrinia furnacalis]|uniref:putative nuclease HARBI1 n=1 Tax=Ostrinia furnacalis TaxID=93504 RepID=UPI00103AE881|nr:putative nuclease HARBI1 [Ostrinia furnacalis]